MSEHDNLLMAGYDARRADDAFAALVRQHLNLVFATALRQVGDAGAAEEITQNVFITLARAAGKLKSHPTIAGWLYQTTLNKSREWLRSELRHRRREQVAVQRQLADAEGDSVWSPLVPLLDEALLKLREPDRLAVIMHFMEGQTFEEVGTALGVGEDTARKRVNRCLHELTHFFQRRGFAVPTLTAAAPLFALASHTAPAGLAASVTTAGMAAAHSVASTSTLTILKGALKIMAWTNTKTAIAVGVGLLLIAGTATTITVKEIQDHRMYPWQAGGKDGWFSGLLLNQQPPQVRILSSRFTNFADGSYGGKIMGTGIPAQGVVAAAYGSTSARTVLLTPLPTGRYDYIASLPQDNDDALQRAVRKKFGVVGHIETRDTNVLVLRVERPNAPGLKRDARLDDVNDVMSIYPNRFQCQNRPLNDICDELEGLANLPVIDQTGLTNHFDFDLHVNWDWSPDCQSPNPDLTRPFVNLDNVEQAFLDQLGLELVPTNMPLEMLVVEKAN